MTESELRFILAAQDVGMQKAILASEKAVEGLDAAVLDLGRSMISYDTAAKQFVSSSGKLIGTHQALEKLGLTTTEQLHQQVRAYDELIARFKGDTVLTRQLISQKQALLSQYGLMDRAIGRQNSGLQRSSTLYFQAGQAVSDFAIAGVRGAANNIEYLAYAMGAGGPLIAAISVASAAFFVFGDDILRAMNPVGERVKELKQGLDEVFEVLNKPGFKIGLFADQLGPALDEQQKKVDNLTGALNALRFGIKPTPEVQAVIDELKTVGNLNAEMARQQALLEEIKKEYESVLQAANAQSASLGNSFVLQNQQAGAAIRRRILDLGLAKELGDVSNLYLAGLERRGELEEFIKKLTEQRAKDNRSELGVLEQAERTNARLKEQLTALQSADQSRLGTLLLQNDELQKQIKKTEEQIRLQRFLAGITFLPSPIVPVSTPSDVLLGGPNPLTGLTSLDETIKKLDPLKIKTEEVSRAVSIASRELGVNLNTLSDSSYESFVRIVEGTERTGDAFRKAGIDAQTFYTQTRVGQLALAGAITETAGMVTGGLSDLFQQLYQSSDSGNKKYFRLFKAFAIAQAIINTYQAATKALAEGGPVLGPILMGGTIALGLAQVAKIAATEPGSRGGAGATAGPPRASLFHPTQGSTGRGGLGRGSQNTITGTTRPDRLPVSRTPVRSVISTQATVNVHVTASDSFTRSGDLVRGIKAALATDKRLGGAGTLEGR